MRIHVIEDDKVFNKIIEHTLSTHHYEVKTFFNGTDFLNNLNSHPDIVTLDIGLPDFTGNEILKQIKNFNNEIEVIVISGQDNVVNAVQLLKEGAFDYITKGEKLNERLHHTIQNIVKLKQLKAEMSKLQAVILEPSEFGNTIIGESKEIKKIFSLIQKAIELPHLNVSIYGQAGTGKELIAKTIHQHSPRRFKPFVAVNIEAIPPELIEIELFGYEKGAFSGAMGTKKGRFDESEDGTIFLDEIGHLEFNLQAKLLHAIQYGEFTRVGSHTAIKINARIITATNLDLFKEMQQGHFREDFYYQQLGLPIHMPPLKDHKEDIALLSNHFLTEFCINNNVEKKKFTTDAMEKIVDYSFPGNVRELKAIVELSAVLTNSNLIQPQHIVFNSAQSSSDMFLKELTLKEYNERIILHYLQKHNHDILKVASLLDIGKSTIYNLLKKINEKSNFN